VSSFQPGSKKNNKFGLNEHSAGEQKDLFYLFVRPITTQ
jgi:hypothetical protein